MNPFKSPAPFFLLAAFFLATGSSSAAEDGENAVTLTKVDYIVVNLLQPTQRFVQVEMTLKLAKQEAEERVKEYMPVIRHQMILLLASKTADQLSPLEGKKKLVQESRDAINKALGFTTEEGVSEVLFTAFIIQ